MKILVLSDSHGAVSPMEQAVEQTSPDLILHLGDCWRDGERLHDRFPSIPLEQVPGNCDSRPTEPAERLLAPRRNNSWTSSSSATPTDPWWTGGAGHCS